MKGQISFVEYLAGLTIFIISVLYIAFQLVGFAPEYLNAVNNEKIRIDTYQISELLVNDPGNPINWNSSSPIYRMGLSNESANVTNFLSLKKIIAFNNYCNVAGGYDNIKRNISSTQDFSIFLFNRTGNSGAILIKCGPSVISSSSLNTTIRRIVAIDSNDIGELIVQSG
jgi:hypothetical protein